MEKPRATVTSRSGAHDAHGSPNAIAHCVPGLEVEKRFASRILLWKIVSREKGEREQYRNITEHKHRCTGDGEEEKNPFHVEWQRRRQTFVIILHEKRYTQKVNMWNEYSRLTNDKYFSLDDFFLAPYTPWTPGAQPSALSRSSLSEEKTKKKPSNICLELNVASETCSRLASRGRRRKIIWRMCDDRRYFSSCSRCSKCLHVYCVWLLVKTTSGRVKRFSVFPRPGRNVVGKSRVKWSTKRALGNLFSAWLSGTSGGVAGSVGFLRRVLL
jgi:hypothetical protein